MHTHIKWYVQRIKNTQSAKLKEGKNITSNYNTCMKFSSSWIILVRAAQEIVSNGIKPMYYKEGSYSNNASNSSNYALLNRTTSWGSSDAP